MAKQITRVAMANGERDPNIADIVRVEWRDEDGATHISTMTDVARRFLRGADAFFYVDGDGNRADVEGWTVYEHPFIRTKGGKAGDDGLRRLPRFSADG